tara:strand:- start:101 stop:529 length:429 start_codon:yes stop_codon:yes gene_type:complete
MLNCLPEEAYEIAKLGLIDRHNSPLPGELLDCAIWSHWAARKKPYQCFAWWPSEMAELLGWELTQVIDVFRLVTNVSLTAALGSERKHRCVSIIAPLLTLTWGQYAAGALESGAVSIHPAVIHSCHERGFFLAIDGKIRGEE